MYLQNARLALDLWEKRQTPERTMPDLVRFSTSSGSLLCLGGFLVRQPEFEEYNDGALPNGRPSSYTPLLQLFGCPYLFSPVQHFELSGVNLRDLEDATRKYRGLLLSIEMDRKTIEEARRASQAFIEGQIRGYEVARNRLKFIIAQHATTEDRAPNTVL